MRLTTARLAQFGPAVLLVLAIYLLATGRWGSYVHVLGVPFYIGDALLAVAAVTFATLRARGTHSLAPLRTAPWALRFALLLLLWSLARFAVRSNVTLVDLRDLAPYAYALTAALAFLMPVPARPWTTRLIYGALSFHAAWFIAAATGWVDTSRTQRLGPPGVTIFSTRPDFDSTVLAIAIGLGLHTLLLTAPLPRPHRSAPAVRLIGPVVLFIGLNAWGVTSQHTRAGLLATATVVAVVTVAWVVNRSKELGQAGRLVRWGPPAAAVAVGVVICALALTFTLPGQRLLDGVNGTQGESAGTANARGYVYENLSEYLLKDPLRTAVGVGFGPDFLEASGTLEVLEGTTYVNVRSPHNYLLGTWARLGVVGALLAVLMLAFGAWLAVRQLWHTRDTVDVLAALVLLALPVPAMLGVILESPFGALPYFWALGHLSSRAVAPSQEVRPARSAIRHR